MKRALVVGGANGIGLGIAVELSNRDDIEIVYIVDKSSIDSKYKNAKFRYYCFDLTELDYSIFDKFNDIDTLIITAGFGRLSLFKDIEEDMISLSFNVNTISVMRIIKHFYSKLENDENFYCGVMVSIAGFMSSPFFSVYAATKAALKIFIESLNVELLKSGSRNKVLNVSPGSLKGTSFSHEKTDLSLISPLAKSIISEIEKKNDLYIPLYDEIYKDVLDRYHSDFRKEGEHSYDYKLNSSRIIIK